MPDVPRCQPAPGPHSRLHRPAGVPPGCMPAASAGARLVLPRLRRPRSPTHSRRSSPSWPEP